LLQVVSLLLLVGSCSLFPLLVQIAAMKQNRGETKFEGKWNQNEKFEAKKCVTK
jgi:hypothetical protein